MPIYTRSGDKGETGIVGGCRLPKDAAIFEALGDLDELNAWLGLVRCEPLPEKAAAFLELAQRRMFVIGGELVSATSGRTPSATIGLGDVAAIERLIDEYEATLEPATTFILPGGGRTAALLHVTRAVCRRTERRIVSLIRPEPQVASPSTLCYLNRLSDLLYVVARAANAQTGISDARC